MFGLLKKASVEQTATLFVPSEPKKPGYEEIKSILSRWVVVRFSVPDHAWNELRESEEWKDFQALLEKFQREHIQNGH